MQKERFEALVARALDELPLEFQSRLENVDVVEDWPTSRQLSRMKLRSHAQLLGLYEGVSQTRRGRHCGMVVPDKMTIFQKPIEAKARSNKEIEIEVQMSAEGEEVESRPCRSRTHDTLIKSQVLIFSQFLDFLSVNPLRIKPSF